jgi:threonine dehydratase
MTNQDLLNCYNRILPYVHKTPVLQSRLINELVGADVFFKCENFQKMGAFKFRGATNAVLQLTDEQKQKGVVTHSSGNFAQALALAAKNSGVKAFIVMPNNATAVKKEAVKSYGGIVIECEPTLDAREKTAQEIQEKDGATFIHPSNDDDVILGQGTACYELLQDYPNIEFVFTPVGWRRLDCRYCFVCSFFWKKL